MTVDGMEIPEWMARNNSEDQIRKFMNVTPKANPNHQPNMTLSQDTEADNTFGVIAITPNGVGIAAMGLEEDAAIGVAMNLREQNPTFKFLIMDTIPLEEFVEIN